MSLSVNSASVHPILIVALKHCPSCSKTVLATVWRIRSARIGRAFQVGLAEENHELFAAEPRHLVGRPDRVADDAADLADHLVAGGVAVEVVDALEVIDVDHQDADRRR